MTKAQTKAKELIFEELLEFYGHAFPEDKGKVLRVPIQDEDGEYCEIKISLTVAKTPIKDASVFGEVRVPKYEREKTAPSQEEIEELKEYLNGTV